MYSMYINDGQLLLCRSILTMLRETLRTQLLQLSSALECYSRSEKETHGTVPFSHPASVHFVVNEALILINTGPAPAASLAANIYLNYLSYNLNTLQYSLMDCKIW